MTTKVGRDPTSGSLTTATIIGGILAGGATAVPLDVCRSQDAFGAHGIGEIAITGVSAAIANAVYHATGKRVTELPITFDKLL